MVHGKRNKRDRQERRGRTTSDKPKAPMEDLELEQREDPDKDHGDLELEEREGRDQDRAVDWGKVNPDEGLADADKLMDDSNGSRDRSTYLVACHWDRATSSRPFSVYKMVDVALSDASSTSAASQKRLKRLGRLKTHAGGKVFTTVNSRNRAWIVGVGGAHGDTAIFDIRSNKKKKVIQGPNLNSAKWNPVLTTVGDKVYAMSKTPSWVSEPDFPPWFEVLDLSEAKVVTIAGKLHLEGCSWTPLPNPPCLPWELSPTGYTMLPIVVVMAYVVVGPYILVSFNKLWGTYAFDTDAQEPYQWHKVDENNLPFTGCATPLGSIFLGISQKDGPINAYRIRIGTSDKDNAPKLSITVLPVKYKEHEVDLGPCFASVDSESFCSLSLSVDRDSLILKAGSDDWFPRKVHVNLTTYQIENPSLLENLDETVLAMKPEIVVSSQQKHALNIVSSNHGFSPFAFSLLSI